ncbi:transcriptional regulator, TetR family [Parasphingorhabdus marina DSM 22363]|uniref:Transcriptional regulator, TetR family n=1 Tax=Parasphingorhabdus marina DSM 22363 TaxID=1123272 RepID=A0A1N6EI37_9SPHN|nr:TetR/AcrR family transcriptional regulator [Parasphingorhabdus marina]SIN82607.1 transcriptional regulator, TetR family [Parasphingorhabdus marina DSM 22363]
MNDPTPVKRRRLSPEKRKELILDHTAEMIAREGVAALSMDRIAKEAGISKSLVYTYYDNLTELLRTLLRREMKRLRQLQQQEAEAAETFEQLVRGVTHQYLKYIEERGLIIERLQTEPSVAGGSDPTQFSREAAVEYLAELVETNFDVPYEIAHAATDISFGLPATAGAYYLHHSMSREDIENITVTMILGTFAALKNEHGIRFRKLKRR